MKKKTILTAAFTGLMLHQQVKAQLFETRSTRYSGNSILDSLNNSGSQIQLAIRDSLINSYNDQLQADEQIETYFDGYYLGLIIYKNTKPHELIGFWNPKGWTMNGGELKNGSGEIKTPFNKSIVGNFSSESVIYENGVKNGACFYFCDCAKVLRKGTFKNNAKEGWWKEFTRDGAFVKQKYIQPIKEVEIEKEKIDWLEPAHCMMRNPNEDIKCPTL